MDIDKFRKYLNDDLIVISEHAEARIQERNIKIKSIINVINTGRIIEEYPEDEPYPSCLILGFDNSKPLHIVISDAKEYAKIVTCYIPDSDLWYDNFSKRVIK